MSDTKDGKCVLPALAIVLLVGLSTLGFAYPDDRRSPETIMKEWRNTIDDAVGAWLPRDSVNPCTGASRAPCCVNKRVELEGKCRIVIPECEDSCMRRLDMSTKASVSVDAKLEVIVDGKKEESAFEWKSAGASGRETTADIGPQAAALVLLCEKSCTVEFR